ncbi:tail fiber domain-containing protein [Enterobacter asburiae]|nr:tail fiber domain-containing protein [Enterobacter asburiae]
MSAGTITLTNGSAIVGGSGTSFATELAAGDFIVSTVGGVDYTLPVKTVDGNTQVTLVSNFTGPTQSGAAWSAVPRVALNMVTAALVAQSAEALRGLNYDKQNWQQVYSAAGNITVKLPDGTTFTGPSWKYLSDNMATKSGGAVPVNQGGTGSTTASGARTNLGLGNSATRDVGTAAGTVAAGDDSRLGTVNGKTGGTLSSGLSVPGAAGFTVKAGVYNGDSINNAIVVTNVSNVNPTAGDWVNFLRGGWWTGEWTIGALRTGGASIQSVQIALRADNSSPFAIWNFNANGQATGTWVNNSDRRIKDDVVVIPEPLEAMKKLRGYSWRRLDSGVTGFGFIAQEVQEVFPEAVNHFGQAMTMEDGTEVKDVLSVDTTGVSAALHHEAILALMDEIERLKAQVDNLLLAR